MDHQTARPRSGLMTVLMVGAACGATVALLLAWKRRTARAADETDLDARSLDMVAEGAPDGVRPSQDRGGAGYVMRVPLTQAKDVSV